MECNDPTDVLEITAIVSGVDPARINILPPSSCFPGFRRRDLEADYVYEETYSFVWPSSESYDSSIESKESEYREELTDSSDSDWEAKVMALEAQLAELKVAGSKHHGKVSKPDRDTATLLSSYSTSLFVRDPAKLLNIINNEKYLADWNRRAQKRRRELVAVSEPKKK
eukprot:UN23793